MTGGPQVQIRPREAADLPRLVEILAAQQPASHYPFRWPLPFPVEQFVVRGHEEAGWVALVEGRVAGHVSVGRVEGELAEAFVLGAGLLAERLALVSVLFVSPDEQGTGLGGRLLDTAVAWARNRDRLPVLDVLPSHGTALAVYRHRGWHEIGAARPAWLPHDEEPLLLMRLDIGIGGPDPVLA
ncbi:MAG: GNAT family N-acetyltransferase [Nocardioides sp.]